jgi:pimeloyl-ACP methyl ester carboxylesterase
MAKAAAWRESAVEIAGSKLHMARAGKGAALLVLHHDIGLPEKVAALDALAAGADVIVPHLPGWGRSERPQWLRSVRDIAVMQQGLLASLGVEKCALLGLGFGGWIAAEMATMAPSAFTHLALVGPMGIKPAEGEILDQAIVSYIDYARAFFHDEKAFDAIYGAEPTTDQLEAWDIAREMSFRVAWKPYMYSQTLTYLLASVKAPALVVWGEKDRVVPASVARQYAAALPKARVEIVKACGHAVDLEQPEALAGLVKRFVG